MTLDQVLPPVEDFMTTPSPVPPYTTNAFVGSTARVAGVGNGTRVQVEPLSVLRARLPPLAVVSRYPTCG